MVTRLRNDMMILEMVGGRKETVEGFFFNVEKIVAN